MRLGQLRPHIARLITLPVLVGMLAVSVPSPTTAQEPPPTAPLATPMKVYLPLAAGPLGGGLPAGAYVQTFDGAPSSPQPWRPANWDIAIHSRDVDTWDSLEPMQAMHDNTCAAPSTTRTISHYEDAVFQCRNHLMTAIQAEGYGVIYLTPNQMIDFSGGEAIIRFDLSTLRTSGRDYVDVWITPYADNLQLPFEEAEVDLAGPPRNAVQVRMNFSENSFKAIVYRNFQPTELDSTWWVTYDQFLTPDPARRDTYELRISRTHIKFGMPAYNFRWVDTPMPNLGWSRGVVQLGHHSYNPLKDCGGPCSANTWHWDNLIIAPAVPFGIERADQRIVKASSVTSVNFASPAPANSHLRFSGIGQKLEVSFDGGVSWKPAQLQAQEAAYVKEEHFKSYWMSIPQGTQQVRFRGQSWYGGNWYIRDITRWTAPAN
jgi:hypothetical protein